ncbi:helix-turn-helix domain-containing protein [Tritonibacter mobilis]|uniref:helix-turn-helix domain-containing protein n=1 Tax=Tritonibacter mobilis TaxID=379347 RepID=UPI000806AEA4|nr:helix-turn-helix transcriptional regulator [Tritonibacter mobilis]
MTTYQGLYLKAVRTRRGGASISEYLSARGVDISETYYRDLEAGRKKVRIETAKELAEKLDLDPQSFFTHLLKDVLDENVFEKVIKPTVVEEMETLADELEKAKEDAELIQAAFAKIVGSRRTEVSDETVKVLNENIGLLPVIHAVYMRDEINFADVESVLEKNQITWTVDEVASFFEQHKLANIDWDKRCFSRFTVTFQIPKTKVGQEFKGRFLLEEHKKSAAKNRDSSGDPGTEGWSYSTIYISSAEKMRALVQQQATKLVARLNADELQLGDEGAKPFFASVIISPRDEYEP